MATPSKAEHSEETAITAYGPPFDDTDADVILRSSDRVDFLVYKVILSKASPVFKTMFSLPQPANAIQTLQDSRPIVELAESSEVLAALLSSIYPDSLPFKKTFFSLHNFITVLDMARKYDMATGSRRILGSKASSLLRDNPLEAFCIAYSRELRDAAQIAARASLKCRLNLDIIGEKLRHTNGPALHTLWKFHRSCSAAAVKRISSRNFMWIKPAQAPWSSPTSANCYCSIDEYTIGPDWNTWFVNSSWDGYLDRAIAALKEHPCSEAVTNQGILWPSYQEPMCNECRQRICGLSEFSRMLGEEVERIISKVPLDLPF